ncbi:hypothetical protein PFNF135_06288, partial [Plasmodium falciparum NF135/5.C10]
MGKSYSKEEPKIVVPNDTYNSPRNVLENIGKVIKDKATSVAKKHEHFLKGQLENASFCGAYCKWIGVPKYGSTDPCDLYHMRHTNLLDKFLKERDPCHGRNQKRFGENEGFECSKSRIKGNENNSDGGSCAPPRRRHICDKNLEALTVANTKNSNDLLGNILVTAKYEGESIVKNHPHKGTSDVCTALARSFADIGDIVRGKDMFLPNKDDKIEKSLRAIFKNIHDKLKVDVKSHYADHDKSGNYYKLREHWWIANRDQVWKAITCSAPYHPGYFRQSKDNKQLFSNSKCGHKQGNVPTNLDYVPQFLRWFDEWAEEFCRKRNIKLENVQKACRDDSKELYCSHNGYNCRKTIRNEDICSRDSKCTGCSVKCSLYEIWLEKQQNEFEKQKDKYTKEIKSYPSKTVISNNNINNEYYDEFYKKLKDDKYETLEKFLNLLNEGKYCKEKMKEKSSINFNSGVDKIFSHSKHCKVCPYCGVDCSTGTCIEKQSDSNCKNKVKYERPEDVQTTEINVLYSGDKRGDISEKLNEFCTNPDNYKGKKNQKWECYYENSENNRCKMENNSENNRASEKITQFHNFFELWVTYLLTETIKWNDKLKTCINNTYFTNCNNECNKNCVCFDRWVKQKEGEWNSIKNLFPKEHDIPKEYNININDLFYSFFFQVLNDLNQGEAKWKELTEELKKKITSSKGKADGKNSEGAIKVLFDHLKDIAEKCIHNNSNESCETSTNRTPNPCANTTGAVSVTKSVMQLASEMQKKANETMLKNSRNGNDKDESVLKGDIKNAKFKNGPNPSNLNGVCSITKEYTNDIRGSKNGGPCTGKDNEELRFKIGTTWKTKGHLQITDAHLFLPPRREHFCTSNLEKLNVDYVIKNDNINASFLVDVLLAANKQVEHTMKGYKFENDNEGKCRALCRSFADLGDIIKGTDMWEKNSGEQTTQRKLKEIFGKIKKELKEKLNDKYQDDTEGNKYINLRKDWWEANRDEIWKAMKCQTTPSDTFPCSGTDSGIPFDDYIPQRLRWMTEWAEWYCKEQSRLYGELVKKCQGCKDKGDKDCIHCTEACKEYTKVVREWENQWKKMEEKYSKLYKQATTNTDIDEKNKDADVLKFLKQLHKENGGGKSGKSDTVYSTAAGYVHQEATMNCHTQNQFCEKKNGVKPSNGREDNEYAFRPQPHDHEKECNCQSRNREPPPLRRLLRLPRYLLRRRPHRLRPLRRGLRSGQVVRGGQVVQVVAVGRVRGRSDRHFVVGEEESETAAEEEVEEDKDGHDDDDDDHEEPPIIRRNPCAQSGRVQSAKAVMQIAKHFKGMARVEAKGRSGGLHNLEGDISKAYFRNGGNGSELKGNICKIDNKYSNDIRGTAGGPCTGKGNRFSIGEMWSHGNFVTENHKDVYMPPRRQHFCTSNLEKLNMNNVTSSSNVNASFLVDVLLAANKEAERSKDYYENKDHLDACRAIRYSFADLGDIIRGRDMWDKDKGSTDMQNNLKTIFKNIYETIGHNNGKYKDKDKYLDLRNDWWSANRHHVWKAMQCPTKNGKKFQCGPIPYDDYIPQRLRWMTEWVE